MPLFTRWVVRTALVYPVLAFSMGLLEVCIGGGVLSRVLWLGVVHLLVVGWLTQVAFGVAYWLFPGRADPRGVLTRYIPWVGYVGMNLGLLLRVGGELLLAWEASRFSAVVLLLAAGLQFLGGLCLAGVLWPRIRPK